MLFSAYSFLLVFLPLVLVARHLTRHWGAERLCLVLLLFSVAFYAVGGGLFLLFLGVLVCVNHFFAQLVAPPVGEEAENLAAAPRMARKRVLTLAVVLNLAPLLWFKYSAFLGTNLAALLGTDWQFANHGLPPGISFVTFIQIAWLVGVYQGKFVPAGLGRHALFSSFFPYVISGPIVRYEQLGPQLDSLAPASPDMLARGVAMFCMGLAKKVLLADSLAVYANAVFNGADKAFPLTCGEAWLGSLCYTFQLYFDFSGYTDMALGLGLMLGLQLPQNFNAPYKATGIVEFWRRWHITLSTWLRDFLYIPLGGNRAGRLKQYRNLLLTMIIGGAWHGAGWLFLVWGALHGLMLCVNHFFRVITRETQLAAILALLPFRMLSTALTFYCLNFCWVVFRATTLEGAGRMYSAMFTGPLVADGLDGGLAGPLPNHWFTDWQGFALLGLSAIIVWCLPSSHEMFHGKVDGSKPWLSFSPNTAWAVGLAIMTFASLFMAARQATFLYFQF